MEYKRLLEQIIEDPFFRINGQRVARLIRSATWDEKEKSGVVCVTLQGGDEGDILKQDFAYSDTSSNQYLAEKHCYELILINLISRGLLSLTKHHKDTFQVLKTKI